MKRNLCFFVAMLLVAPLLTAQQKLAQTGFKFLNVAADARTSALGGALTSVEGFSSSIFSNPAAMARTPDGVSISFGKTLWFADIEHAFATIGIPISGGDYGVVGLFVQGVDYGDVIETIRSNNALGYVELGKFSPSAISGGASYARAISEKFSVGGNIKYARQFLGNPIIDSAGTRQDSRADVVALDFGILYRTGFKSLNFGMTVRNFSREIRYVDENFQLPLIFKIGMSMNMLDLFDVNSEVQSFLLSVDADHARDYPEQVHLGAEYTIFQILSLRGGYITEASQETYSLGFGVKKENDGIRLFSVDYSFTPFKVLGNVHRFSFQFIL